MHSTHRNDGTYLGRSNMAHEMSSYSQVQNHSQLGVIVNLDETPSEFFQYGFTNRHEKEPLYSKQSHQILTSACACGTIRTMSTIEVESGGIPLSVTITRSGYSAKTVGPGDSRSVLQMSLFCSSTGELTIIRNPFCGSIWNGIKVTVFKSAGSGSGLVSFDPTESFFPCLLSDEADCLCVPDFDKATDRIDWVTVLSW